MLVSDNTKHGVNKFIAINLNLPISHRSEDSCDPCEGGIVKSIRECLKMEVVHAGTYLQGGTGTLPPDEKICMALSPPQFNE